MASIDQSHHKKIQSAKKRIAELKKLLAEYFCATKHKTDKSGLPQKNLGSSFFTGLFQENALMHP